MTHSEDGHEHFMDIALSEAEAGYEAGSLAAGCIIVRSGEVVGRGQNRVVHTGIPTDHAEIDAIRDACLRLETPDLAGTTAYVSNESCPMCLWAMHEAGISRIVIGATHRKLGMTRFGNYTMERLIELTGSDIELITGVREAESLAIRGKGGGYVVERSRR